MMKRRVRPWTSREQGRSIDRETALTGRRHHMFTLCKDGKMHLAPLKPDIQVKDVFLLGTLDN